MRITRCATVDIGEKTIVVMHRNVGQAVTVCVECESIDSLQRFYGYARLDDVCVQLTARSELEFDAVVLRTLVICVDEVFDQQLLRSVAIEVCRNVMGHATIVELPDDGTWHVVRSDERHVKVGPLIRPANGTSAGHDIAKSVAVHIEYVGSRNAGLGHLVLKRDVGRNHLESRVVGTK